MTSSLRLALACLLLALHGCGEPPDDPATAGSGGASNSAPEAAPGASPGSPPAPSSASAGTERDDRTPVAPGDAPPPPASTDTSATLPTGSTPATPSPDDTTEHTGAGTPEPTPATPVFSSVSPTDCAAALPCRLTSADGAFALTLHAADGEALDGSGPLRLDFVLEALSRDAAVALERSSSIVAGGQVLEAEALELGLASAPGSRDEAAFTLLPGVPINGHATFAGELVGNPAVLDRVTLRLSEAGRTEAATFANVPLGAERSAPIDCANALPCEWRADDGGATLALSGAAPLRWNRATRLVVSWSLAATRPLELVTLPSGTVTNGAGETLEPYGIELAGTDSRDGTPLVHALGAGESVGGRLVPRRAPAEGETTLARVAIAVVERRAPRAPRWRPVFLNVPLAPTPSDDES